MDHSKTQGMAKNSSEDTQTVLVCDLINFLSHRKGVEQGEEKEERRVRETWHNSQEAQWYKVGKKKMVGLYREEHPSLGLQSSG